MRDEAGGVLPEVGGAATELLLGLRLPLGTTSTSGAEAAGSSWCLGSACLRRREEWLEEEEEEEEEAMITSGCVVLDEREHGRLKKSDAVRPQMQKVFPNSLTPFI
jgi:hypothetical protein